MQKEAVRTAGAATLAVLCAVLLVACAPLLSAQRDGPFLGDWRLVQAGWGNSGYTTDGAGVTLISDGRHASGFSGCGAYAVELTGTTEDFRFGERVDPVPSPFTGDAIRCHPSLERLEERYLTVLLAVEQAEERDDQLLLTAGDDYLVFQRFPAFPGTQLLGTEWVLEQYGELWRRTRTTEVLRAPTLRFLGTDRIVGTLSCGTFAASYRVVRTEVQLVSLQRSVAGNCTRGHAEQDRVLSEFLGGFRAFLAGDRLVLLHDRTWLLYRPAASET